MKREPASAAAPPERASVLHVDVRGRLGTREIGVAFAARGGEPPTVVVGPNGAGKTSLLLMILGAVTPESGRVSLGETVLFDSNRDSNRGANIRLERRRIGYLPQRYALFPHLSVLDNVAYGIPVAHRAQRREQAWSILRTLDAAALASRNISALSGGEAQRVALARALASQPRALLLDEPLAALDAGVRADVRRVLADQLRGLAIPTVVVTHDHADAEALGGEILVLENGRLVQRGTLSTLVGAPASEFVRSFFAPRR